MHYCDDRRCALQDDVVDDVRKASKRSFTNVVCDDRILLRILLDYLEGGSDSTGELVPQAGASALVPEKMLRLDQHAPHHEETVAALLRCHHSRARRGLLSMGVQDCRRDRVQFGAA